MRKLLRVSALACVWLPSWSAWADMVKDQYQEADNSNWSIGTSMAQTFTAGVTGLLDHVEVSGGFGQFAQPEVEIRTVTAEGEPNDAASALLGSITAPQGSSWITINFDPADIFLTAGQMYVLVLRRTPYISIPIVDACVGSDSYQQGSLWATDWTDTTWSRVTGIDGSPADMTFRTFVVEPVPLPGAALLGAIGLGCAGWRLRRRSRGESGAFAAAQARG